MSRKECFDHGQGPRELEAFYVQAKLREAVHNLLGLPINTVESDFCASAIMVEALLGKYFRMKNHGSAVNITRERIRGIDEQEFNTFLNSFSHIDGAVDTLNGILNTRKDPQMIQSQSQV
jgi:hypothetical protein